MGQGINKHANANLRGEYAATRHGYMLICMITPLEVILRCSMLMWIGHSYRFIRQHNIQLCSDSALKETQVYLQYSKSMKGQAQ